MRAHACILFLFQIATVCYACRVTDAVAVMNKDSNDMKGERCANTSNPRVRACVRACVRVRIVISSVCTVCVRVRMYVLVVGGCVVW